MEKTLSQKWVDLSLAKKTNILLVGLVVVALALVPVFAGPAEVNEGQVTETSTTTDGITDWVISYNNDTGGIVDEVDIKKEIPENQAYVNNSLKVPGLDGTRNWFRQYTTGAEYQRGNPPADSKGVGAIGYNIPSPATGASSQLRPSVLSNQEKTNTGGDGWGPIPYRGSDGVLRVFNVFHHFGWNIENGKLETPKEAIVCTVASTGELCDSNNDGREDGKFFLRTNEGADVHTADSKYYVSAHASKPIVKGSKLFYPVQQFANENVSDGTTNTRIGLTCFDMETFESCGFKQLKQGGEDAIVKASVRDAGDLALPAIGGAYVYKNKFVYTVTDTTIYCFNLNSLSACGGKTIANFGKTNMADKNVTTVAGGVVDSESNRLFIRNTVYSDSSKLACLDVNENTGGLTLCDNWGNSSQDGVSNVIDNASFEVIPLFKANSLGLRLICTSPKNSQDVSCYSAITGNEATGATATAFTDYLEEIDTLFGGPANVRDYDLVPGVTKIIFAVGYVASNGGPSQGGAICWNYGSDAPCANFGNNGFVNWNRAISNLENPVESYAINHDDLGCFWALGNHGNLFSFDPQTGSYPCNRARAETVVNAPAESYYCDGKDHTVTWDKVFIYKEDGDLSGIKNLKVTVKDVDSGTVLKTADLDNGNNFQLDVSDISYAQHPSLTVTYEAEFNTTETAKVEGIFAVLTFNGDDPQICFQTYSTLPVWSTVKSVTPEVARPGDEVVYTISVTNEGHVNITNVKVTDPLIGGGAEQTIPVIEPGETKSVNFTYTVPEDQIEVVNNVAKVCIAEEEACQTPEENLDIAKIKIEKSSDPAEFASPGQTVIYSFKVTNVGTVTLDPEIVVDNVLGEIGDPDVLKPGESETLTKEYVVPEDTPLDSEIVNVASVCAPVPDSADSNGISTTFSCDNDQIGPETQGPDSICELDNEGTVCDDDNHVLKIVPATIEIVKTADKDEASSGDTVTYSFAVTNPSKVDLKKVVVTDDVIGDIGTIDLLKAGETQTLTKEYSVPDGVEEVNNTATACFEIPKSTENCASDDHTLTVPQSADVLGAVATALPFTGSLAEMLAKSALWILGIGAIFSATKSRRKKNHV